MKLQFAGDRRAHEGTMECASILLKPRPLKAPLIACGIRLSNPTVHCSRGEEQVRAGGGRGGELEADGVKLLACRSLDSALY